MQDRLTFAKIAQLTLERVRRPLTPVEIWEQSEEIRKSRGFKSEGKTPWFSIGAQIYVDIRDHPDKTVFYQQSERPARFYLKKYKEKIEVVADQAVSRAREGGFNEADLHPFLARFIDANGHFIARSKTIHHESSSRKSRGYNEWLHPDLVAVHYPFEEFGPEVLSLQKQLGIKSPKLFSFEIKQFVGHGDYKKDYFEAVSNCSWANEGYLVALKVQQDSDLMDELRRLNGAFGIGIIELNAQDVDQSQILFPSRLNPQVDWSTVNRLAKENPDFRSFLEDVKNSMEINKVTGKYDESRDPDSLTELAKSKKMTAN